MALGAAIVAARYRTHTLARRSQLFGSREQLTALEVAARTALEPRCLGAKGRIGSVLHSPGADRSAAVQRLALDELSSCATYPGQRSATSARMTVEVAVGLAEAAWVRTACSPGTSVRQEPQRNETAAAANARLGESDSLGRCTHQRPCIRMAPRLHSRGHYAPVLEEAAFYHPIGRSIPMAAPAAVHT